MSVTARVNPRLAALSAAGTSVWLDQIQRSLIESGELRRLVEENSLGGVTSNPAIFEKAILASEDYDAELVEMAGAGLSPEEIYLNIAVRDVQLAADVLLSVWEQTGGEDGFVSLEVAPQLARDTEGSLEQARALWKRVDRPNLMVKIPGTAEGMPAIEEAIYEGINVNVTLLFAVEAYVCAAEAFLRGLERRRDEGEPPDVHSVASFFVSRVDTEVDRRVEAAGHPELRGTAALANARAAYRRFREIFEGGRFDALREAGARVQRPLWASTGVKNQHYSETMYVEGLVGPHTVSTMPMPTLLAVAEHGKVAGPTIEEDYTAALDALRAAGVDMGEVTDTLLEDGIELFAAAMDKLIAGVTERREAVVGGRPPAIRSVLPGELEAAVAGRMRKAGEAGVVQRLWRRDGTLWGEADAAQSTHGLGWLTISEPMLEHAPDLLEFVDGCRRDGLTDAVLLGMGGSSLGPEVIRRSFGEADGALRLHVLDSTDPGAVLALERRLDLRRTLFVVSSKSGATIETLSHFRYFRARLAERLGDAVGDRFVAVTDAGTPLVGLAEEQGFRRVFENDPDIGGRYSVLSYFGLLPAALMGVDVEALLHRAQVAEQSCMADGSAHSGLWLGLVMGELAARGRDKLTFCVSKPIASLGLWVEQLVAESLGKEGTGIVPVVDEPLGPPEVYRDDRVFARLREPDEADPDVDAALDALAAAGHPVVTVSVHGAEDLGRIFFIAEFATAVAGWVLGVNPFDQPNVQEAKDRTASMLERYTSEGPLPDVSEAGDEALRALLGRARQTASPVSHYVAIMAYAEPSEELDRAAAELRAILRGATRVATTFAYGPRFLHSTGQLHKGGPPTGLFLQLVHDGEEDAEVPAAGYSFGALKNAQSLGDLETLRAHGLPTERVRLRGDPGEALRSLTGRIKELL